MSSHVCLFVSMASLALAMAMLHTLFSRRIKLNVPAANKPSQKLFNPNISAIWQHFENVSLMEHSGDLTEHKKSELSQMSNVHSSVETQKISFYHFSITSPHSKYGRTELGSFVFHRHMHEHPDVFVKCL